MKWTYDGHSPHNNEDDYTCSNCGYSTWFATYTNPNKLRIPCPKCRQKVVIKEKYGSSYGDPGHANKTGN